MKMEHKLPDKKYDRTIGESSCNRARKMPSDWWGGELIEINSNSSGYIDFIIWNSREISLSLNNLDISCRRKKLKSKKKGNKQIKSLKPIKKVYMKKSFQEIQVRPSPI